MSVLASSSELNTALVPGAPLSQAGILSVLALSVRRQAPWECEFCQASQPFFSGGADAQVRINVDVDSF